MARSFGIALVTLFVTLNAVANNVRIMGDVKYDIDDLGRGNVLNLKFNLKWDNSWRDDYNWDAVYVCFKYKLVDPTDTYTWHHIYFNDRGVTVSDGYDYSVATANARGKVRSTGLFVYRKINGGGDASVEVSIPWDVTSNEQCVLQPRHFNESKVLISAIGVEMVYVPTGAFKLGDSNSEKTFRKFHTPIPEEYDIVSGDFLIEDITGGDSHPELAADRINDNESGTSSCWAPNKSTQVSWRIDFGENQKDWRTIRFFGVNGSKHYPDNKPVRWALYGSNDKNIPDMKNPLWQGGPEDWIAADDAYPIEHAIKVEHPQPYRYYHVYIESMQGGRKPVVKSIGMADVDVNKLLDYSVLIDNPNVPIDSLKGIGAWDEEDWGLNVSAPVTTPNYPKGFLGFYAMKYEISQEQYVKFLNKLTRAQQVGLLPDLSKLKKGDFLFGNSKKVTGRNGIYIANDEAGKPYAFADSLDVSQGDELSINGETIACNFMSVADMLAYADWMGLRPLSEMEYEKMARRPFPIIPLVHEYAWNTANILPPPSGIENEGTANETASDGNANYGNALKGPLRVGAFAVNKEGQEESGVGFYGAMDLSGNLSEIYYNFNPEGRKFNAYNAYSHGDGYLSVSGAADIAQAYWPISMAAFALRGGSYRDSEKYLATSDRSRSKGYFSSTTMRDSTVSFRLGYSAMTPQNGKGDLDVYLTLQNGKTSKQTGASDTICGYTTTYTIVGNKPSVEGAYSFIWYMLEDGGKWRILEGENDPSLTYSKFINNWTRLKHYYFKRVMITTTAYAETGQVEIVVDQVANAQINRLRDTIDAFENTLDGFYAASTIPSEFKWRWIYRGKVQTLSTYASGDRFSHYVPDINQFRRPDGSINYGENVVQLERTTKGMNSCYTVVELSVFIEDKGNPSQLATSKNVRCGNYMRDTRDNQVYPTTLIGNQCWMGKNLNYSGYSGVCYNNVADNCRKFGRMYTWYGANGNTLTNGRKRGACPDGWHLPDNSEWATLARTVSLPGKRLKASKYWTFVDLNTVGTDDVNFGALPGGYYMSGYTGINNYARWWTSNLLRKQWSHMVSGGYWTYCPNHGRVGPPTCYVTRWIPPKYETHDRSDGYYFGIIYNSTGTSTALLRSDANYYNSDRMYVRCVKD